MKKITTCELEDLKGILELYQQLHPQEDANVTPERQRAYQQIMNNPHHHLMVVKEGKKVIATAHLVIITNLSRQGAPSAYIENVVVHASYRSKGLGAELLDAVRQKAAECSCYKIFLCTGSISHHDSDEQRQKLYQFYEKCGFKQGIKNSFVHYFQQNI